MNALQLTDYLPEYPGNFGDTLIELCKKTNENNGICIISFPIKRIWHKEIVKAGGMVTYVPVHTFKEKKIDLRAIKIYHRLIKRHNINLVHVHFGLSQKITTILLKLINPQIKVIWHWRGDVTDNMSFMKGIYVYIFYRLLMDFFVCNHIANSISIYDRLIKKKLVNRKKLFTLPNSVNINRFSQIHYTIEIDKLVKEMRADKFFTIIMIRNFRGNVDFNIILETMAQLKEMDPYLQLLWIGYGETEDIIKKQIEDRRLINIKLLGKISDPIPFYYISKINIIAWEPWCNETINNTVYEALMCDIPVVGLNFGALPKTFSEGEGVFTVPLDAKKYAEKILYIKNNIGYIASLVKKGREKVTNEFSTDVYIKKLFSIYNNN